MSTHSSQPPSDSSDDNGEHGSSPVARRPPAAGPQSDVSCVSANVAHSAALLRARLRNAAREGFVFRTLTTLQKLVELLGDDGARAIDSPDEAGRSALTLAAAHSHPHIVQALLSQASDLDYQCSTVNEALVRVCR